MCCKLLTDPNVWVATDKVVVIDTNGKSATVRVKRTIGGDHFSFKKEIMPDDFLNVYGKYPTGKIIFPLEVGQELNRGHQHLYLA
jgi:hypothetical protein